MAEWDLSEYKKKMQLALDALAKEFLGIRAGRACTSFLDPIRVDSYGAIVPLSQVGTVTAPEARLLSVQVWDKNLLKAVEKAIRESNLGLNPSIDGMTIRIALPSLTEQRRQELSKVASKYAEDGRITIRSIRRDAMDFLKKLQKDSKISEDDQHRHGDDVQKATDESIKKIEAMLEHKQKEIMHI